MELKIIGPEGKQTHSVLWIELNTAIGNFTVQPGHTPTIVSLAPDKEIIFCLTINFCVNFRNGHVRYGSRKSPGFR